MAPWWPGTALLSTKAPRKLVFLFTLSLSVTYLFYSLLSCYSSLQFPLQDAGIYLQPDSGVSPVDAIRAASLKPDTSNRDIIIPEEGYSPLPSHKSPERRTNNTRPVPQETKSSSGLDSYFQSRIGSSTNDRDWDTTLKADLGPWAKKSSGDISVSPSLVEFSNSLPSHSLSSFHTSNQDSGRKPVSLEFSSTSFVDTVPQSTVRTNALFHSVTERSSTVDSVPISDQRVRSPIGSTALRFSSRHSTQIPSTAVSVSTLDSAPIAHQSSTLDSAPIAHQFSTLESDPVPSSPQRFSTPDSALSERFLRYTNAHVSLPVQGSGNVNKEFLKTDSQTPSSNIVNPSVAARWNDFSTADSASLSFPAHKENYDIDGGIEPIKSHTVISASSSGEISRPSDFTGNEMHTPLQGDSTWDGTPLAATEMIPESHTGFLEREPQESSTTEEEFSHRISVNSTAEYGDKKLPQAIIIGVKKGGTRALLEALRAHPDVRAVGVEPHFFDRNYEKGLEWYRDLMPRTIEGQITMEKTPSYFVTNEAPQRIHSMAKDTKLIVVVRNPVTRAISDYTQTLSKKPEIPTFEVLAFKNRTLGLIDASWSALRIGIYALHLESWMQYFPLSQILFVSGERLISNPAEELAKVQEFLGLRRIITDKHFYFNKTKGFPCLKKPEDTGAPRCLGKSKGRTHPKIDPDVIQRLRKFYKPFNAMFYQMTGEDFEWEKEELES
ncbi:uncharacterized protein LOC142097575 [Mixophyes fleayi]|uniref:uncharacterized protein LOC142097575 n=1 Tax=Mixophyes fleayi TaxID=3061075 RepID=UPI003F4D8BF2